MDSNKFRNRAVTKRRRDITIWRIVTDEDSHQLQTKDRQMTMTKKHFTAMAIQFAKVQSTICTNDRDVDVKATQLVGVDLAIEAFCKVAKESNPAFDKDYFLHFIHEIFYGQRDENGKLVRNSKKIA